MTRYVRLCQGVAVKGQLVPETEVASRINAEEDWYQSAYYYNEKHLEHFKETGSIKGIRDVVTDKLFFDFDYEPDPEIARQDAIALIDRLKKYSIKPDHCKIYFSGSKGYNVLLQLPKDLAPSETGNLATKLAMGLKTFDASLYDASQIVRVPGTKHQKTNLYKTLIGHGQLMGLATPDIRKFAAKPRKDPKGAVVIAPTPNFFDMATMREAKKPVAVSEYKLDLGTKPSMWRNCKWSILQGNFKEGERQSALMVLAATCRALKYDKETTYFMCKSAIKKSAALYGTPEFRKEDLWEKIIEQSVFADGWQGGQYSCKTDHWLRGYCESLGEHACQDEEDDAPAIPLTGMFSQFSKYAANFDENVVKTGIPELDDHAILCASTLNGLLGQPGAGKTTMALNYLRNTSLDGISSMFFSLDMGLPIVYAKLAQKNTGYDFRKVMEVFRTNEQKRKEIADLVAHEYANVGFNFKSGLTVADMKNAARDHSERTGKAVKLIVIDYLECIAGPYSDPTANTGFIANLLKDMANELGACVLLLLQTQKHSTPQISDPLLSLKGVKGSSLIEQSCSTILTLWREGYSPDDVENDQYISFAIVKNRFGSLWRGDFGWDGVTGSIHSLAEEERFALRQFKEAKKQRMQEQARAMREEFGL